MKTSDISLLRSPPHNIEAEESLLSNFINTQSMGKVAGMLKPEDFYKKAHQNVFDAISHLHNTKQPIDLPSIYETLKNNGKAEETGGASNVARLIDIPLAVNPVYIAEIIKACSVGREIIQKSSIIISKAYGACRENIVDLLDSCQSSVLDIKYNINNKSSISYSKLCNETLDDIEELNRTGIPPGVMTGFPKIDRFTGGFWGPMLVVIAARPGIGKTALMLNMAYNMGCSGERVTIYSLEMSKKALMRRQIASLTGINLTMLRTGQGLGYEEFARINTAAEEKIIGLPIYIDDGYMDINELKRRIRIEVKNGSKVIFIDQLSKIAGGKGNGLFEQFTYLVLQLSLLKKELEIPIVLLAQINRKLNEAASKKPTLFTLKQTGQLEEDADIVLLGHRNGYYSDKPEDEHHAEWEIAKNKDGPCFNIPFYWNGKTTTFNELELNR